MQNWTDAGLNRLLASASVWKLEVDSTMLSPPCRRQVQPRSFAMKRVLLVICMLSTGNLAWAQAPSLSSAASFAVLGSSTVTCTGATTITGDVGVSPGSAVTGFPAPCTVVGGAIHAADAVALQAHHDAAIAYSFLKAETCNTNLTGQDLGGLTLSPGVYCFDSSAELTGTLNLTGGGPWIFQTGSTLATASNAVVLVNGSSTTQGSRRGLFGPSAAPPPWEQEPSSKESSSRLSVPL